MSLIIAFLTAILFIICLMLVILILAQLPKKDAGAGLAFGGGTAEAIFGAGASTPLAQITKYCAGIFLGLALTLSALNAYRSDQNERLIDKEAARQAAEFPQTPPEKESLITELSDAGTENPTAENSNADINQTATPPTTEPTTEAPPPTFAPETTPNPDN